MSFLNYFSKYSSGGFSSNRKLRVEQLEDRRMLATMADVVFLIDGV